jgi:hypothetical protein
MKNTTISIRPRRCALAILAPALLLAACGSSRDTPGPSGPSPHAPASPAVVRVGATPITLTEYEHWMKVGAATVAPPPRHGPLPAPVTYTPPQFTACVSRLRARLPKTTPTAPLRLECKATYEGIQTRILNFLITGLWVREEARAQRISLGEAEVRRRFQQEKQRSYPTPGAFRRFQEASGQSVPDLMFAVRSELLSTRLLEAFATHNHRGLPERSLIAAFNTRLRSRWIPRTNCQPGYVVPDCKQYHPKRKE